MYNAKILDGITNIDEDLIAKYLCNKEKYQSKRRRWNILHRALAAVAACLLLALCLPFALEYVPVKLDLDYSRPGPDAAFKWESTWVYYVEGSETLRERVYLPGSYYPVFVAWRHLNDFGDEVQLLDYAIENADSPEAPTYVGENVYHFALQDEGEDQKILYITLTDDIESYFDEKDRESLMLSLIRSITERQKIQFRDIYIILSDAEYVEIDYRNYPEETDDGTLEIVSKDMKTGETTYWTFTYELSPTDSTDENGIYSGKTVSWIPTD